MSRSRTAELRPSPPARGSGRFARPAVAPSGVPSGADSDRIDWQPAPEAGPDGQCAVVAGLRVAKALVRSSPTLDSSFEPRVVRLFETGAVLGWVRPAPPEHSWTAAPVGVSVISGLACEDQAVTALVEASAR